MPLFGGPVPCTGFPSIRSRRQVRIEGRVRNCPRRSLLQNTVYAAFSAYKGSRFFLTNRDVSPDVFPRNAPPEPSENAFTGSSAPSGAAAKGSAIDPERRPALSGNGAPFIMLVGGSASGNGCALGVMHEVAGARKSHGNPYFHPTIKCSFEHIYFPG